MPTVLLLDRESSRRQRLVELIKCLDPGIHIEAFIKPEPALAWLAWQVADLVVADSLFPSMDAADLIRRIRAVPSGPDLPLLMMAPWGNQERRRQVLDAGATDLLATPVDDLEFRARCNNLLTQRRQQRIIHERACWLEQRVSEATSEIRRRDTLEQKLQRGYHYALCRRLGQLRPADVCRVRGPAFEAYAEALTARGMRLGDIKPTPLSRYGDWSDRFDRFS